MQTIFDRPVALRKTVGSLSSGTRVDAVQNNDDGTVLVRWQEEVFTVDRDNLVLLRNKKLRLPGAELRRRMAIVLGTS